MARKVEDNRIVETEMEHVFRMSYRLHIKEGKEGNPKLV
jgi:hypothetical protein